MKLFSFLFIGTIILSIQNVSAETKLELNVLFDVASKMATTTFKPFCITVLTDLIVEPNNKKENKVPLMILSFDTDNTSIEKAQVTCPNLIIGNYSLPSSAENGPGFLF